MDSSCLCSCGDLYNSVCCSIILILKAEWCCVCMICTDSICTFLRASFRLYRCIRFCIFRPVLCCICILNIRCLNCGSGYNYSFLAKAKTTCNLLPLIPVKDSIRCIRLHCFINSCGLACIWNILDITFKILGRICISPFTDNVPGNKSVGKSIFL